MRTVEVQPRVLQEAEAIAKAAWESLGTDQEKECEGGNPWSAFGQLIFVEEHQLKNGKTVKKLAGVSMAYPDGVHADTVETIMRETLSPEASIVYEWEGEKEGKLVAMSKAQPYGLNLALLDRFVDTSQDVISRSKKVDKNNQYVEDFFALQPTRRAFLSNVKNDVQRILATPTPTMHSAFDPRYKEKGLYVVEMIIDEDGVLKGVTPYGDDIKPLLDIVVDESHRKWITWLTKEAKKPGRRVIADGEDTETVKQCGGNKGCSAFFEEMEGRSEKTVFSSNVYADMLILPTLAASYFGEDVSVCSRCEKVKRDGVCNCQKKEEKKAA